MKISHFFTIAIITFFIVFSKIGYSQSIGKMVDGNPKICVDRTTLIKNVEESLKSAGMSMAHFNTVEINNLENDYVLTFKGNNVKTSFLVTLTNGSILIADGKTSCTTTDCASSNTGCVPRTIFNGCTPCENKGKCSRTSTSYSQLGNQLPFID